MLTNAAPSMDALLPTTPQTTNRHGMTSFAPTHTAVPNADMTLVSVLLTVVEVKGNTLSGGEALGISTSLKKSVIGVTTSLPKTIQHSLASEVLPPKLWR
jgi:hypothetical protein